MPSHSPGRLPPSSCAAVRRRVFRWAPSAVADLGAARSGIPAFGAHPARRRFAAAALVLASQVAAQAQASIPAARVAPVAAKSTPVQVRQGSICLHGSRMGFVARELLASGVVPVAREQCNVLIYGPEDALATRDMDMLHEWLSEPARMVIIDGTGDGESERRRIAEFGIVAFGGGYPADAVAYARGTQENDCVATPLFAAGVREAQGKTPPPDDADYPANTVKGFFLPTPGRQ